MIYVCVYHQPTTIMPLTHIYHDVIIQPKVVIVSTSANDLKGLKTGVWLEELAVPYYLFRAKGYQVVVSSIKGGEIPIDAASLAGDFYVADSKKFMEDDQAMDKLRTSLKIGDIDFKTVDVSSSVVCFQVVSTNSCDASSG